MRGSLKGAIFGLTSWPKPIGRILLFVFILVVGAVAIYFAWYYFSGQEYKRMRAEFASEVHRIERNARFGYHSRSDPVDTSPLGVLRFEFGEYEKFNDQDVIESVRKRMYPTIPRADFYQWMRDPYGQEKIDLYLESHKGEKK